jgi:hypothetical protein
LKYRKIEKSTTYNNDLIAFSEIQNERMGKHGLLDTKIRFLGGVSFCHRLVIPAVCPIS